MNSGLFGRSLQEITQSLEIYPEGFSLGSDLDEANLAIEGADNSDAVASAFRKWAARFQPCLFGRIGSRSANGVNYDFFLIDEVDQSKGDLYLFNKIQEIRRTWKDRALDAKSSALLILFKNKIFSRAKPGLQALELCKKISNLYFPEHAPVKSDVIYTEAIPLKKNNEVLLFKAGVNIFYGGAHQTLNHDRRIPGGILLSINSPGHLANSLVINGLHLSLPTAVKFIYETAMHSVGNGGLSWHGGSATWHNELDPGSTRDPSLNIKKCPRHIPQNYNGKTYSALYHTDVLIPELVTVSTNLSLDPAQAEVWKWLSMDYIADSETPTSALDEWFSPDRITEEAIFHNPWPPLRAMNSKNFIY